MAWDRCRESCGFGRWRVPLPLSFVGFLLSSLHPPSLSLCEFSSPCFSSVSYDTLIGLNITISYISKIWHPWILLRLFSASFALQIKEKNSRVASFLTCHLIAWVSDIWNFLSCIRAKSLVVYHYYCCEHAIEPIQCDLGSVCCRPLVAVVFPSHVNQPLDAYLQQRRCRTVPSFLSFLFLLSVFLYHSLVLRSSTFIATSIHLLHIDAALLCSFPYIERYPNLETEQASTGRAGCQNKECKDEKVKIAKGELRLGTWVDTERIQAFFWRHWWAPI